MVSLTFIDHNVFFSFSDFATMGCETMLYITNDNAHSQQATIAESIPSIESTTTGNIYRWLMYNQHHFTPITALMFIYIIIFKRARNCWSVFGTTNYKENESHEHHKQELRYAKRENHCQSFDCGFIYGIRLKSEYCQKPYYSIYKYFRLLPNIFIYFQSAVHLSLFGYVG